jgi:hypothetical protein
MLQKFVHILELGEGQEVSIAKISTLKILCHISTGITLFNPNQGANPLIADEGYYQILSQSLMNTELLIRIRDCIKSECVEVVEHACIAIGFLVKNDLELAGALYEYHVIDALLSVIGSDCLININEYALWCLFNI